MTKTILTSLIVAGSLMLFTADANADGETWCKAGDPNDTYVNLRYPANGRITGSRTNGTAIWVDPSKTKTDNEGRRWTAVIRNDRSGNYDYVLARFTYNCSRCEGRSCRPIQLDN